VTEGKPCASLNESSEGIEYKPFYGHFAATGEELAAKEAEAAKGKHKGHHSHAPGATESEPPPSEAPTPSGPGENEATIKQTGGASPG
jgi:hypothetical protein